MKALNTPGQLVHVSSYRKSGVRCIVIDNVNAKRM